MQPENLRLSLIRNFGITCLDYEIRHEVSDQLLAHACKQLGVDQVSTVRKLDSSERQAIARGPIYIKPAVITTEWEQHGQRYLLNLIENPGDYHLWAASYHTSKTAQLPLRIMHGSIAMICGHAGVDPLLEWDWRKTDHNGIPKICFVYSDEWEHADFFQAVSSIRKNLKVNPVPIQLPVCGPNGLIGIVDLIHEQFLVPNGETPTGHQSIKPIPSEHLKVARQWKQALIETLAEHDLNLLDQYCDAGDDIPSDQLIRALRTQTLAFQVQPVLCGSVRHSQGIQALLNAVIDYLPSAESQKAYKGRHPDTWDLLERKLSDSAPFTGLSLGIAHRHPQLNQDFPDLIFIMSGRLDSGQKLLNIHSNKQVKVQAIFSNHFCKRVKPEYGLPGDICALSIKNDSHVGKGEVLCDPGAPMLPEWPDRTVHLFERSLKPDSPKHTERTEFRRILFALSASSPIIHTVFDPINRTIILRGNHPTHLEEVLTIIRQQYKGPFQHSQPRLSFREVPQSTVRHLEIIKKQTGGSSLFAKIEFELGPREDGNAGLDFINEVRGGEIPSEFIPAIKKGLEKAMDFGVLGGYAVESMRVRLLGGTFHIMDSTPLAFELVARNGFKKAAHQAGTGLLEPVMEVLVRYSQESYPGAILNDLISRGATLKWNHHFRKGDTMLSVTAPLRKLLEYKTDLKRLSPKPVWFSMQFLMFVPVPEQELPAILKAGSENQENH